MDSHHFYVGLDLGQRNDYSALAVVEWMEVNGRGASFSFLMIPTSEPRS